jgi:hypothetical protein
MGEPVLGSHLFQQRRVVLVLPPTWVHPSAAVAAGGEDVVEVGSLFVAVVVAETVGMAVGPPSGSRPLLSPWSSSGLKLLQTPSPVVVVVAVMSQPMASMLLVVAHDVDVESRLSHDTQ